VSGFLGVGEIFSDAVVASTRVESPRGVPPRGSSKGLPNWRSPSSQKPACGFPAQASSVMDSQNCQGFHPTVRNVQPWLPQREALFDFAELLPCDVTSLTSGTEHPAPASFAGSM